MPKALGDDLATKIKKEILAKGRMRFSQGGIVPGQVCQEQERYRINQKKLEDKKKAEAYDEIEAILNKTKKDTGFDDAIIAAFKRNRETIQDLLNGTPFQKFEKKMREVPLDGYIISRTCAGGAIAGNSRTMEHIRKVLAENARDRFICGLGWRNKPNAIGQFIYNKERERIGVLVAYKASRGRVGTGWSLCNKKDKFSITEGVRIAFDRMFNIDEDGILPSSIRKMVDAFDIHAEKFFESDLVYLKNHEKNWNKFFNSLPEGIKEEMKIDYKAKAKEREALKKEAVSDVMRFRSMGRSLDGIEFYHPITEKEAAYSGHFEVTVKTIKKK